MERVEVGQNGTYIRGEEEVVLVGGNYVVKAPPYMPSADRIRGDAESMAAGLKKAAYQPPPAADGTPRSMLPLVRISALWEGAMPNKPGELDAEWTSRLEAAVEAFAAEGVYVIFDIHQDAVSTTNGGEGFPWWVASQMQEQTGCCCTHGTGCFGCYGPCGRGCGCCGGVSYVTSRKQPLQSAIPLPNVLLKRFSLGIDTVDADDDPWFEYSVDDAAHDPARMNLGNANMRLNNNDSAWGRLLTTKQVQNVMTRFYDSPFNAQDREAFFGPYCDFVRYLCGLWSKYSNVVAIGLLNEPPISGIPWNLQKVFGQVRTVRNFFAEVMLELEAADIKTPMIVEDMPGGNVRGTSLWADLLALFLFPGRPGTLTSVGGKKGSSSSRFIGTLAPSTTPRSQGSSRLPRALPAIFHQGCQSFLASSIAA
eukprot:TRINITY_DN6864_c0_g1_i2.p1 TRINITY_DN6864_c0_g1~~TRINITY_DN6864_c0_g1_i2.p1  ORF type:complete len:444 (-),score=47.23 TRINITY_DN6864_c0_g1_i2:751-2019(-)